MNLSYFKASARSLTKNKFLSFLNILGLSAGLAVAILIFNYSLSEFRADKQYNNLENIYVVRNNNSAHVHYELASLLKQQVPGIRYVSMVESNFRTEFVLTTGDKRSFRSDIIIADSNFVRIFNFSPVSGYLEDALAAPGSIILTRSEANRLFGNDNAIGKILSLKGTYDFLGQSNVEVKAVINDLSDNSNFQFKAVVSHNTTARMMPWIKECIWSCSNVQNYVLLEKGVNINILASRMSQELRPLIPNKIDCNFSLLPYNDVYFSDIRDDFRHGSLKLIYLIGSIGLLILIIAVINYINLTISGLARRQTEVGIKKIFGISPGQLIFQILIESVIISFIAMSIGALIAYLVTPSVNKISAFNLPEVPVISAYFWLILAACSVVVGVAAGLLPALSFNRFRPVYLITGRPKDMNYGVNLKRGLILLQFIISIILIICTITVTRQLSYMKDANMGFNTENIINIQLSPEVNPEVFKEKLQHNPGIESVSFSRWYPGNIMETWEMPLVENGVERKVSFAAENADASYVNLMGLKIVQGRNFSDSLKSDIGSALINETAAKEFGLEKPLDAFFRSQEGLGKIIGILRDFNFQSLHKRISPLVIFCADKYLFSINIKLLPGNFNNIRSTLNSIHDSWNEVSPGYPFEYKFIDQEIEKLYKSELMFEKIFRSGSFFAIFISCLGLLGLVLDSIGQRKKEIGIRKVNGAKTLEVLILLNKEFIQLVIIAFVIAGPVAFYFMRKWLENFAYRTSLTWWIFVLAGILAMGIALFTVSWQTWKAATMNPSASLRYE